MADNNVPHDDAPFYEAATRPKSVSISTCGTDPLAYRHIGGTGSSRASSVSGHSSFFEGSCHGGSSVSSNDHEDVHRTCGDEPEPTGPTSHTNVVSLSTLPGIRQGSPCAPGASAGGTTTKKGAARKQRVDVDTADIEEFVRKRAGQGKALVTNSNGDVLGFGAAERKEGSVGPAVPARVTGGSAALPTIASFNTTVVPAPIASIPTSVPMERLSKVAFATIESVIPRSSTVVAAHTLTGSVVDCGAIVALADGTVVGTIATLLGAVLSCRYAIVGDSGAFAELLMKGREAEESHNAAITAASAKAALALGAANRTDSDDEEETHKGFLAYTPLAIGTKLFFDTTSATIIYDPTSIAANQREATDASFVNDDELPDNKRPDFSDDEKERDWKRERKAKTGGGGAIQEGGGAIDGGGNANTATAAINDDDDVMPLGHVTHDAANKKKKSALDADANAKGDVDDDAVSSSGSEAEFDEEGAMVAYRPSKRARGLGNVLGIGVDDINAARKKTSVSANPSLSSAPRSTTASSPAHTLAHNGNPASATPTVVVRGRGNMQQNAVGSHIIGGARQTPLPLPLPPQPVVSSAGTMSVVVGVPSTVTVASSPSAVATRTPLAAVPVVSTFASADRDADVSLEAKRHRAEGPTEDHPLSIGILAIGALPTLGAGVANDAHNESDIINSTLMTSVDATATTNAPPSANASTSTLLSIRIGSTVVKPIEVNGGAYNTANNEFRSGSFMSSHGNMDDIPIVLGVGNNNASAGGMRRDRNGMSFNNNNNNNASNYNRASFASNTSNSNHHATARSNITPHHHSITSNMTSPNASLSSLPHLMASTGRATSNTPAGGVITSGGNAPNGGMTQSQQFAAMMVQQQAQQQAAVAAALGMGMPPQFPQQLAGSGALPNAYGAMGGMGGFMPQLAAAPQPQLDATSPFSGMTSAGGLDPNLVTMLLSNPQLLQGLLQQQQQQLAVTQLLAQQQQAMVSAGNHSPAQMLAMSGMGLASAGPSSSPPNVNAHTGSPSNPSNVSAQLAALAAGTNMMMPQQLNMSTANVGTHPNAVAMLMGQMPNYGGVPTNPMHGGMIDMSAFMRGGIGGMGMPNGMPPTGQQ